MAKLTAATCPNCGANLEVDPGASSATCHYCQTTSQVQSAPKGRPPPRPPPGPAAAAPRVIYVQQPAKKSSSCLVWVLLLLLMAGGAGAYLLLGTSSSRDYSNSGEYAGDWKITSANNPGSDKGYKGTVNINQAGDTYTLRWDIKKTKPYRGVGLPLDDALAVGWATGAQYGVAVYEIKGGRLIGKWATESSGDTPGTEILQGPSSLKGTYNIVTGKDPTGKSYTGKVIIKPKGQTYSIRWKLPSTSYTGSNDYTGVGIKHGNRLVFGWGLKGKGAGVVVYRKTGKTLTGVWAMPQKSVLGTENLERAD